MINYNWDCRKVDAYVEQGGNANVVHNVNWRLTGSKNNPNTDLLYSITNIGTQSLDISEITNFIPWNEVTQADVEAWTKEAMGEEQVLAVKENIAAKIRLLETPVSVTLIVGMQIR